MPDILRTAALIWIASVIAAAIRGVNTHDPAEIARRLLMTALLCVGLAVALTAMVGLILRFTGIFGRLKRR